MHLPEAFEFLFEPSRYKVAYGGRGSGKSESFGRALLIQGAAQKHTILCTRELQVSIQDSVHRLLATLIADEGYADQYEVLQTVIRHRYNGTEFLFKGLKHNISEIKGLHGVTRVWAEEAENISHRSWEVLIPTIRAEGSEIWVSFNPKNLTDPTYERFVSHPPDNAIVRKVSWRDNPFFPDVLRIEKDTLHSTDPEAYEHVWEGAPDTRRSGSILGKQLGKARDEGRLTRVPYDPSSEVFTAWDLGWSDSTAIWWLQFVGRELRWLDFYENNQEELLHYVQVVKNKPYNYKMHYLPHDGGANNIRAHNGLSVSAQLTGMGIKNTVLQRESDLTPGIELLRKTIGFSVFDQDNCKEGLKALEAYRYKWDEERHTFKKAPDHDWSSHAASAARYAAIAASTLKSGGQAKSFKMPPARLSWMGA